jgi:hypothetical protein
MARAFLHWVTLTLLFAVLAMSFLITVSASCSTGSSSSYFQGPFCSVQHTAPPAHTEKHTPDMARASELSVFIFLAVVSDVFSKLILEKTLKKFTGLIDRLQRNKHIRSRSGPLPFNSFLPQVSASHGF